MSLARCSAPATAARSSHPSQGELARGAAVEQGVEARERGFVEAGGQHLVARALGPLRAPRTTASRTSGDGRSTRRRRSSSTRMPASWPGRTIVCAAAVRNATLACATARSKDGMRPRHDLDEVLAPGGIATGVVVERRRRHRELACDEGEHDVGRRFADLEHTAGAAQVEEHERETEPVGVASLGHGLRQVVGSGCSGGRSRARRWAAPGGAPTARR